MTKEQEKTLRQDLFKLQATFLLSGNYEDIKEDFVFLCELGLMEALELYYNMHEIGENEIIDSMVDGFPDCDANGIYHGEIMNEMLRGSFVLNSPNMSEYLDNSAKAQIKYFRRNMHGVPRGNLSAGFFEKMAEFPMSCGIENGDKNMQTKLKNAVESGSDWVIIFTSMQSILYNGKIKPEIAYILTAVKNQPHTKLFTDLKNQKNGASENIDE